MFAFDRSQAFAVFDRQDSGCVSYGIVRDGRRLFVKTAAAHEGRLSLRRAIEFHRSVQHATIVRPIETHEGAESQLVYPWCNGMVLNRATVDGGDRSALTRFQRLPVDEVTSALTSIVDAHVAITAAGFVAVDLYDGCFLYDFDEQVMRLVDMDEYRPGPFVLDADRLPGSTRYMAPEEFRRGAVIDERTTVFNLGRTIVHLLDGETGWRGSAAQRQVVTSATQTAPSDQFPTVAALAAAWNAAT